MTKIIDLKKEYKIEYGNAKYYKSNKQSHTTRILTKKQAELTLKKLNKIWEYTTLFKLEKGKWNILG